MTTVTTTKNVAEFCPLYEANALYQFHNTHLTKSCETCIHARLMMDSLCGTVTIGPCDKYRSFLAEDNQNV